MIFTGEDLLEIRRKIKSFSQGTEDYLTLNLIMFILIAFSFFNFFFLKEERLNN